jgi:hypothetical protein
MKSVVGASGVCDGVGGGVDEDADDDDNEDDADDDIDDDDDENDDDDDENDVETVGVFLSQIKLDGVSCPSKSTCESILSSSHEYVYEPCNWVSILLITWERCMVIHSGGISLMLMSLSTYCLSPSLTINFTCLSTIFV